MSILCSMVGASFNVTAAAEVIRKKINIQAFNQAQISTAQSKFSGTSALFDGNDDYLVVNDLASTANSDFTWECWARFDILPNSQTIGGGAYMMLATGGSDSYFVINNSSTQPTLQIAAGNKYGSWTKSGVTIAINTWYHIAYVRSSGVWKTFFNGTELTTFTNDFNFTNSGRTENMSFGTIGRFIDSRGSMDGYIDEIRVSKSARYTADFTPSTTAFTNDANTLLLVHCNGTNSTNVFDDDNGIRAQKNVTPYGNTLISTAQSKFSGTSALFDGTGDYLDIGPGNAFGTGDFTIECWIYPTNVSGIKVIYDDRESSSDASKILVYMNGTSIYYYSTANHITGTISTANTWYHIAVSRSSGTVRLFVNGTQAGSNFTDTNSKTANSVNDFLFGQNCEPASRGADQEFTGYMDEIRISNTARYTTNFTPSTTPFVNDSNTLLLVHCDGTSGSTVFRDDNGTRTQKGIQAIGNAQISTAQSKFGGTSALFDNTGDYLTTAYNSDFNFTTQDFTIELWCYPTDNTSELITNYEVNTNNGWSLGLRSLGRILWVSGNGSTGLDVNGLSPENQYTMNAWNHIAITRSGSTLKCYVGGTQQWSATISNIDSSTAGLSIGRGYGASSGLFSDGPQDFGGYLDEIRISNTVRYTANFTAPTASFQNDANTVLLMHMDGTNASTVFIDDNGIAPYTP